MADGRVVIETKLDTSGLEQGAKTAKTTVENLGKGLESAGKQSNSLDTGIQGVTASLKTLETIAKSSVVVKLTSKAMQLIGDIASETSVVVEKMKAASTLFGDVAVDETNLLNQLYKISNETGESMEVLGQSVYDALSASVEPTEDMANVLQVVSNSAKLAKGGFTNTSTALSATLTVINAYKKDLTELDSVQSMLLQTQNKGVTTVGELGEALATVTPTAASFGVAFEDIATSIALMTKQGTNTRVATTALAQVISELGKSGTTASKNLASAAESAGLAEASFKGLLEEGYSLGQILEIMNQYAKKNGQSMVDLFSSVEAGRATLQLVGDNAQDFNDILESMNESSGLVSASFEKTVDQTERLSSAWSNLLSRIGMKMQPAVASLSSGLAGVIEKMAGQEVSSGDLATALEDVETATRNAETAQKALEEALNSTTQAQYQQTYASVLTAVKNMSDAYDNAVSQMEKYDKAAKEANITLLENQRRSQQALVEAQKLNEGITFEDLIKQCVEYENGLKDLAEIFPYTAEQERDALAESVLYVAQAEKSADAASDIADSWRTAVDDYINSMARMVQEGTVSISTLRAINIDLADDVEKAMEKVVEVNDDVVKSVVQTKEDIKDEYLDMLTPIISKYQELMTEIGKLGESELIGDEQKASLQEFRKELVDLKETFEETGPDASSALALLNTKLEEVNNALKHNSSVAMKEMQTAYDAIINKSEKLTGKMDALGNEMYSNEEVVQDLNDLYRTLAEKYGTASAACLMLKKRINELNDTSLGEKTAIDEVMEAYQKIIDKSAALTNKKDALGNVMRTEQDDIEELNNLYIEVAEKYGTASDAAEWLRKKINELNKAATSGTADWKDFCGTIKNGLESAGQSVAQGLGSAVEDLIYQLATIPEQIDAIDEKIADVAQRESDNIKSLTEAEADLMDAKARGNAKDIEYAKTKIAKLKETSVALEEERKTLEKNKESVQSGTDAWKSMSKVALLALADTLESLGAQLAAQAVVQAVSWNWGMAAIATAGSVAAFIAAGAIKAAAAKYEQGGIVGGNSRHGDQIIARVNSGELILNTAQQDNLARVIEAAAVLAQTTGQGAGVSINFEGVNFYGLDEPAVGKAIYENIKTLKYEGVI